MLDLTSLDTLQAISPDLTFSWRTRRIATGWQAQCTAGFPDHISPRWQADGRTEQEALDTVVGYAISYWREFVRAGAP